MGKRFTDTEIYDDPWYCGLTAGQKLFWDYICRKCDASGVWKVNQPMAEFCIGMRFDLDEMKKSMEGRVEDLGGGKWWIIKFCDFQYGTLRQTCKPHASVMKLLESHGLLKRLSKGYRKGNQTLKEKEKEKEEEKEKDERFDQWYDSYGKKVGRANAEKAWRKLKPEERDACLGCVKRYVQSTPDIQYRPHPATYLNQRRWEDEIITREPQRRERKLQDNECLLRCSCGAEKVCMKQYYLDQLRCKKCGKEMERA